MRILMKCIDNNTNYIAEAIDVYFDSELPNGSVLDSSQTAMFIVPALTQIQSQDTFVILPKAIEDSISIDLLRNGYLDLLLYAKTTFICYNKGDEKRLLRVLKKGV